MKEAAGEANMTVITIVLIAIVLGVGTIVVNQMLTGTAKKSACNEAGGSKVSGTTCQNESGATVCTLSKTGNDWGCK